MSDAVRRPFGMSEYFSLTDFRSQYDYKFC